MISPLKIQVRFSDIDLMGHVNNAVYLNYFEAARMHYLLTIFGEDRDWKKDGIILRKNEIEYIAPVFLKDEPIISVFLESIGTKSFTLIYELNVNGEIKTVGKSVLVYFDSTTNRTKELTEELKNSLKLLKKIK